MSEYYHSLNPFRELFKSGVPILTYHKLGPRPPRVRIKGLYLSEKLFRRQLAEFREEGFRTTRLAENLPATGNPHKHFVVTFDDGFSNVHDHALVILEHCRMRAIEFLVADLIGKTNEWEQREGEVCEPLMDETQIRDWLAAGHEIGSHTLTHPWLTRLSPAEAREQITSSKKKLEDRFGRAVEHFCYPYGDWNEAVRDLVQEAGYLTACTTESGINTVTTPRLALKRITARYPSRRLSAWLKRRFNRGS